jgi:hypothetical protein
VNRTIVPIADVVLYGLRVRSEFPLPGRPAVGTEPCDLEIVKGDDIDSPVDPPPGTKIAHSELSADQWYTFTRLPSGDFVLRYAGLCDFVVDADLRRAVVNTGRGADTDMVTVLAAGALMSFVLIMSGEPVLHASAVDIGGRALAFVGRSGMGKSTMATLCCAAGGQLITDDVLRLTAGPAPRCYLGTGELRLRFAAAELADSFVDLPVSRPTADGRDALSPDVCGNDLVPLAAIVVPLPSHEVSTLRVVRLGPMDALTALVAFPRILGWQEPPTRARQFKLMGEVSSAVPVYTVDVPWGPPFAPDLVPDMLAALESTSDIDTYGPGPFRPGSYRPGGHLAAPTSPQLAANLLTNHYEEL